jgi:hypothetical protein
MYSQEFSRYQLFDLVQVVSGLVAKYKPYNIYVDAANPLDIFETYMIFHRLELLLAIGCYHVFTLSL